MLFREADRQGRWGRGLYDLNTTADDGYYRDSATDLPASIPVAASVYRDSCNHTFPEFGDEIDPALRPAILRNPVVLVVTGDVPNFRHKASSVR